MSRNCLSWKALLGEGTPSRLLMLIYITSSWYSYTLNYFMVKNHSVRTICLNMFLLNTKLLLLIIINCIALFRWAQVSIRHIEYLICWILFNLDWYLFYCSFSLLLRRYLARLFLFHNWLNLLCCVSCFLVVLTA